MNDGRRRRRNSDDGDEESLEDDNKFIISNTTNEDCDSNNNYEIVVSKSPQLLKRLIDLERCYHTKSNKKNQQSNNNHKSYLSCFGYVFVLVVQFWIILYHSILIYMFKDGYEESKYSPGLIFSIILNLMTTWLLLDSSIKCKPILHMLGFVERNDDGNRNHHGNSTTNPYLRLGRRPHEQDDDEEGESNDTESKTSKAISLKLSKSALKNGLVGDATAWWITIGHCIAFMVNTLGEIVVFGVGISQQQEQTHDDVNIDLANNTGITTLDIVFALVYIIGALICTTVLTLGSCHLALTHHLLSFQINELVNGIQQQQQQQQIMMKYSHSNVSQLDQDVGTDDDTDRENVEEFNHLLSSSLSSPTSQHALSLQQKQQQCHPTISAQVIINMYFDFRQRVESLTARGLYSRIGIVFLSLTTETIVVVSQGFVQQQDGETSWQILGVVLTFFGNSFCLWSLVYSLGRVMFVQRQKLSLAVSTWAISKRFQSRRTCTTANSEDVSTTIASDSANGRSVYHHQQQVQELEEEPALAHDVAQFIIQYPIRFHTIGTFEISEDVVKGLTLILLGLAALFVGVTVPPIL